MPLTNIRFLFVALLVGLIFTGTTKAQSVPTEYAAQLKGLSLRQQVDAIDSLARGIYKTDPAKCVLLLKSAIRLSIELGEDSVEIQERMNLNRQYRMGGENDSAMMQVDTSIQVAHDAGLSEWEGEVLSAKGVLQARMGLYDDATETFLKGIELAKSIRDTATLAMLNKQWAMVYFYTTDFRSAIDRTQQALQYYSLVNDTSGIAACTDNIGLYYSNLEEWDSAFVYQLKALKIFEAGHDSINLLICYNNLGSTLINTKQYDQAKLYLNRALEMSERRGNNYQTMTTLTTFTQLYEVTGDQEELQKSALRVYEIAQSLENDFYAQTSTHLLAQSYYLEGNFEKSAFYFRITDSLRQVIFDSEKIKSAEEAAKKYEASERKQQIALLEADNAARAAQNERDTLVKYIILGIVLVLLIFCAYIIRNYYRKKRDNRLLQEQNEAIEEQRAEIEMKNVEITDSISYAQRIQNAVLPSGDKLNALFPDSFIYYRPRDIISGDFYWTAEGRNGVRFLAVADCTGHGVPGAMMSMLGTSILNRLIARKSISGPGKILDALHDELLATLNATKDNRHVNDGMDIVMMMYDPEQRRVVISSADRPVYIVKNGALEVLRPDKISIGSSLQRSVPYAEHVVDVTSTVSVFLFTDGIVDQFGGWDRKKFMSKRLKNLIDESVSSSLKDRGELFTRTFDQWKSGMEQTDDMTLINVVFK